MQSNLFFRSNQICLSLCCLWQICIPFTYYFLLNFEKVQVDESNFENKWRAWWLVALMATSFGIGELSHFVLGSTSRDMAQELQYGDQSCLLNNTGTGEITCADYTTEIE